MESKRYYSIDEMREERGNWVFLIPISNLKLSEATNFEFRIDRVTVIASDELPRRRKRFGLPNRISEVRHRPKGMRDRVFDSPCFATLRRNGKLKELERGVFDLIRRVSNIGTIWFVGLLTSLQTRNELGLPSSLVFLFTHATLLSDPGRPSATSPLAVALHWLLDLRLHRRLLSWT